MNELREITVERTAALHGEYPRFRLMARIEHMVLLITFTIPVSYTHLTLPTSDLV